jgi:hypothetical protein
MIFTKNKIRFAIIASKFLQKKRKEQQLKFNYYYFFKPLLVQSDVHEPSRRRSYSNAFNQSDSSLETSFKTTVSFKTALT